MFRRRSTDATTTTNQPKVVGGSDLAAALASEGWILPRNLRPTTAAAPGGDGERPETSGFGGGPHWSLVGTVGSELATPVDPAGLVSGDGWSLDWWIGADDRWHFPTREAAVRQSLLDRSPVVETLLRIPGGDAVHRAYGIRSPRTLGDEWVVAEISNVTAIPFAVALVIRPFVVDAVGAISEITIEPVAGGTGRDVAHLVRVDGRPAMVLPRRPARVAVGSRADGDVEETVTSGSAGSELLSARCPDGFATMAMIFPLTHTSTLRVLLPVGSVPETVDLPGVVPEAVSVAAGWDVHRRGPRVEVPDSRLAEGFERARAHVHLAHDGAAVRRDGQDGAAIEPGATEVILGAFDLLAKPDDVGRVLSGWMDLLQDADVDRDTVFLTSVSRHWRLHRVDALLDWMLPEVAAAVERIDRAHRRGRLDRSTAFRAAGALAAAARLLTDAGQVDAGTAVAELSVEVGGPGGKPNPAHAVDELMAAAEAASAGEESGHARIRAALEGSSPTTTWSGPGRGGRRIGHDLAASAGLLHAVTALLISDRTDGIALVPHLPDDWYGASMEAHDVPTSHGTVSFAVRWHGTRPALLWEVVPHDGIESVTLTAPGLDSTWRSSEVRGDALLAEIEPPASAEKAELVIEHPDIDPEMRRPGSEPAPPPAAGLPEGGSFS